MDTSTFHLLKVRKGKEEFCRGGYAPHIQRFHESRFTFPNLEAPYYLFGEDRLR